MVPVILKNNNNEKIKTSKEKEKKKVHLVNLTCETRNTSDVLPVNKSKPPVLNGETIVYFK